MEETIGYEALFSAEEWASLDLAEWDEEVDASHSVSVTHDATKTSAGYELECKTCGPIGSADDEQLAGVIARLHENFVAKLVGRWSVGR